MTWSSRNRSAPWPRLRCPGQFSADRSSRMVTAITRRKSTSAPAASMATTRSASRRSTPIPTSHQPGSPSRRSPTRGRPRREKRRTRSCPMIRRPNPWSSISRGDGGRRYCRFSAPWRSWSRCSRPPLAPRAPRLVRIGGNPRRPMRPRRRVAMPGQTTPNRKATRAWAVSFSERDWRHLAGTSGPTQRASGWRCLEGGALIYRCASPRDVASASPGQASRTILQSRRDSTRSPRSSARTARLRRVRWP